MQSEPSLGVYPSGPAIRDVETAGRAALGLRMLTGAAWLVVITGLALRLWHVGRFSLWFDEVDSIAISSNGWLDIPAGLRLENYPLVFPYLLKLWMLGGTSDVWLRSLPALLGAAVVAMTWIWSRQAFGPVVGVTTTVLVSLSGFEVLYSQYLRVYMLFALLTLVSLATLEKAVRTNRTAWWVAWASAGILSLYTFYFTAFVLLAEVVWLAVLAWRRPVLRRPAVLSCVGIGLAFAPWLPVLYQQYIGNAHTRLWYPRPTLGTVRQTYLALSVGGAPSGSSALAHADSFILRSITAPLALLGLLLPGALRQRLLVLLVIVCGIFLPIVGSLAVHPFYDLRYEVFVAAPVFVLVARGLVCGAALTFGRLSASAYRIGLAIAILALAALEVYPLRQVYSGAVFYPADFRGAVAYVLRERRPGDVLLHGHQFTLFTSLWYAYRDDPATTPRPWDTSGRPVGGVTPALWVKQAPIHQPIVDRTPPATAPWMPTGSGRLWLMSMGNLPWFHPDHQWRLVRTVTRFHGVMLRLYVRQ